MPNDVNNLFDIKPKITQTTTRRTQPPSLSETKIIITTAKAAVATTTATTVPTTGVVTEKTLHIVTPAKTLKSSSDSECFTTTQNETSQMATNTKNDTMEGVDEAMTNSCYSGININNLSSTTATRVDEISHSLYNKLDTRCRYCCMQFLKVIVDYPK